MKKHLLLTLLTAAITLSTSCLKKQNLEEENLGSAFSSEEVSTALGDGFGTLNYSEMLPGEKSSIVFTQALQAGSTQAVQQQDITINAIANTSSYLDLDITAKNILYQGSGTTEENVRLIKSFTKYSGYAFADDNEDGTIFMFEILQNIALGACNNSGTYPETCHNLSSTPLSLKVSPSLATQHPSCTDINDCYIPARRVEFDLIRHYQKEADGQPKRIHYTFLLSNAVPFMSRVLKYCTRSLYDLGSGQPVMADLCYSVNSYTFGH